ncbi:hypothetical protein [Jeongeupia chitinilytica]|uniref:Uncharacterized protein n=1 Tax=Jeongeupia chitinilytica TaxID=1041641 RepID=A0ABQ3GXQ4_9NEIS|nr:hypothetical protein [Jeongeupia chitinilytica]GHD60069.1 hypothetical protein GCM10007350_12450 [Jeongeupia chitinilytica]
MSNLSGNAYALTVLSPIKPGIVADEEIAYADKVRSILLGWNELKNSPMTAVPQTYLCRYFVLDNPYTESLPGGGALDTISDWLPVVPDWLRRAVMPAHDQLKSRYLVFSANVHVGPSGDIAPYLRGMWQAIRPQIESIWQYCYGFDEVKDADGFAAYIQRCALPASLFFVGSNDEALPEQLKALYIKQEFAKFAVANQGLPTATLRQHFRDFMTRIAPHELAAPTWEPGKYRLP